MIQWWEILIFSLSTGWLDFFHQLYEYLFNVQFEIAPQNHQLCLAPVQVVWDQGTSPAKIALDI